MKAFTKDLAGAFRNSTSLREMTRNLNSQGVVNAGRGGKKMKGKVAGLFLAGVLVVVTALSLWGGALVAAPEDKDVTGGTIFLAESDDYQVLAVLPDSSAVYALVVEVHGSDRGRSRALGPGGSSG